MTLPSKELLSEVLSFNVLMVINGSSDSEFLYRNNTEAFSINIYEFAYKCKEWAKSKKITLEDKEYPYLICSNIANTSEFGASARIMIIDEKFRADTEPEAIFLACEWILKNKNIRG